MERTDNPAGYSQEAADAFVSIAQADSPGDNGGEYCELVEKVQKIDDPSVRDRAAETLRRRVIYERR